MDAVLWKCHDSHSHELEHGICKIKTIKNSNTEWGRTFEVQSLAEELLGVDDCGGGGRGWGITFPSENDPQSVAKVSVDDPTHMCIWIALLDSVGSEKEKGTVG